MTSRRRVDDEMAWGEEESKLPRGAEENVVCAQKDDTGTTSSSREVSPHNVGSAAEDEAIAKAETKAVWRLRLLVFFVLIVSMICVAVSVYLLTSRSEVMEFGRQFQDDANKVLDALGRSIDLTLGGVDALVVSMVSYAKDANQTWPFVTLPHFAVRAQKIRSLTNAVFLNIYPLVTEENRDAWENYTAHNNQWVDDGISVQERDNTYKGPIIHNYTDWDVIHDYDEFYKEFPGTEGTNRTGPYLPMWQSVPVIPRYPPYNWDLMSAVDTSSIEAVFESHRVSLSEAYMVDAPGDPALAAENQEYADWFSDYIDPGEEPMEPVSDIYYPIIEGMADSVSTYDDDADYNPQDHSIVGLLALSVYWRDMIKDILPPGSNGIVLVFENECNPTFTYQINGPTVTFLGSGDMHDARYDHLVQSSRLFDLQEYSIRDRAYTGISLNELYCPFHLRVYPSIVMQMDYTTRNPAIFTVVAVLIFAFTSAVFILYDWYVERRQRAVMKTAAESTAMVKERTRELEEANARLEEANRRVLLASAAQLQHFACMSHEIRTPLNCIIGLSSLLQDTELNSMQRESMEMIVDSGNLLSTVVDDVLDYSKLESGNVDIEIKRSNLQETLSSVVHSIETRGQSKNVSVRTFYGADVCEYIMTDSRRLQQILFNLLGNAIKFSKEGGVVELRVSICSPLSDHRGGNSYSPSNLSSKQAQARRVEDQVLRFTIKDYGKGLEQEDFGKIFQPFQQVGTETELVYGGTGLGLAIAAKLVHALGGSISVDSEVEKWTRFSVDFPFTGAFTDIERTSKRLKNATILFVDDKKEVVEQVSGVFRRYDVDFAEFGDMNELKSKMNTFRRDRSYICLIAEDLFDGKIYELLSTTLKSVLITSGPRYSVKEAENHYRSLVRVLPSVLLENISAHVSGSGCVSHAHLRKPSSEGSAAAPYSELRVLLAEDNVVNQKVLGRILNRLGIENVEVVDNGQKAVDCEAAKAFDVILLDMQMPVMDGIEACRLINARQGGHPKAKVVFVTAHVSDSFKAECHEAGAVAFLPKPCNIGDVDKCFQSFTSALR